MSIKDQRKGWDKKSTELYLEGLTQAIEAIGVAVKADPRELASGLNKMTSGFQGLALTDSEFISKLGIKDEN